MILIASESRKTLHDFGVSMDLLRKCFINVSNSQSHPIAFIRVPNRIGCRLQEVMTRTRNLHIQAVIFARYKQRKERSES